LGSDANLRLLDPQGKETPLQTRVLARWADGSVKWVLLDFQAKAPSTFRLEYGRRASRAAPASKLRVAETAEGVEVATGPLKLAVSRTRFGFPGSVWLDANGDGRFAEDELMVSPRQPGELLLVAADRGVHSSLAPPAEVVLEETGPLRVTVRASGGHYSAQGRKLFAYTSRIHAYAGQPYLRVQHTFTNDAGQAEFTSIRSLTLRLPMVSAAGGGGNRWLLGDPSAELKTFAADRPVRLAQHRDDRYSILEDHNRIAEGPRSEGLAAWSDGARTVTLAVRDFWQSYPKDLSVSPAGFELGLCPPLAPDEYADAKGTTDDHRLYYYLQGGLYKLRQGVTKTHDLWLDFEPAATPVRSPRRLLIAVPSAKLYADTKAFGDLALPGDKGFTARYESAFAKAFQGYLENREKNREYGMLNFGDWWGERAINWGNSEYDTQYGFLLQFARTADPRYFRVAQEVELHNRDVDTVHAHSNSSRIGGMYAHCVGHTGDYYSESPVPNRGITQGGMMVSHTFIEGHLDYYFLTGDRRSLETAEKTADRYDLYQPKNGSYVVASASRPGLPRTLPPRN